MRQAQNAQLQGGPGARPSGTGGLRQAAVDIERPNVSNMMPPQHRRRSSQETSSEGRRSSARSLPGLNNNQKEDWGPMGRSGAPGGGGKYVGARAHNDFGVQIGEWLARTKMRVVARLHGKPKGMKEEEVDTLAAIIRMYRGVQEDDQRDEDRALPDRGLFEIGMGLMIVANMVVIGLELEAEGKGTDNRAIEWIILEAFFCFIFVGEIALKFIYHGWRWIFYDYPNLIHLGIAVCMLLDCAVFHPMGVYSYLRMASLARVLGLISLRRTFARLRMMEELCGVLDGLWTTASAICWVMILCFFFLYMCSVFVTEQIGHNEDYVRYRKISGGWDFEDLFGTIGRSMLTLLQMMTLDSWSSQIARHVISMQWEMGAFFIIFLVLSTYGLLNIVISIIVEHMLQAAAKNDRKAKARLDTTRKQELESIKEVFILSDTDGSGEVDLQEFLEAVKNPEVQWRMRQLGLPLTGAAKLFAVIDGDGSRTLTITEFINGCKKLKGTAQSKDLLVIQAQADILSTKMEGLQRSLEDSERMMQILDDITRRTDRRFTASVDGARRREAKNAGGQKPFVPLEKKPKGQDIAVGNCPMLPQFPSLIS